ncbi:CPSF domain-containing protein [Tieghemostelium lacteum]|uniref:CPSF domain-containing protein n=1 Tax=Tieghemostelium lacteum TaxID=361077 RepID=A0A152A0I7_TIELA|nr:CPSF domain-containing protein [Tieghemostelium lacteum]|eukprot:KYQ99772.1 CPSF domain-containing protein [Tieghemostelium lacteum]
MYLYNLTLQNPTTIYQCISGNFSGTKSRPEVLVSHGRSLELFSYDDHGKLDSILYTEIFGTIRSMMPFRLTGGNKDYIIIGSDSGRVVILEYNPSKNQFDQVHQETFGRSGCRRIVPGQYLAVDPKGRAFMIGAIEKQKLVYILNRDSAAKLTISSPLEAHKSNTILFSMCGVDVGFENPIFATLSVDYSSELTFDVQELDSRGDQPLDSNGRKKMLTFYELDLGLNNVVRKWSDEVDFSSNIVMTVPGGSEGPGGVLICSENYLTYRNQSHPERRVRIPLRQGSNPNKGLLIVSHALHKQKDMFFFLIQSEIGDLYKVTLDYQAENVENIRVCYFDTIPVSSCINILKTGFFFSASEFGDHGFYYLNNLEVDESDQITGNDGIQWFPQHGELKNLLLTHSLDSLAPVMDFKVMDLVREENPQFYSLCGVSQNSSLKVLRHGLPVTQFADTPLPGVPSGIWTVPKPKSEMAKDDNSQIDKYIVVSFVGSTLVLAIEDEVKEVSDSGILDSTTTLLIKSVGADQDSIIQVYANGMRHIKADKRINEWRAPGKKTIVHACANQHQVVIALTGGELIYFEIDQAHNLVEIMKKDMRRDISSIEISPVPRGRQFSKFLAVSDWEGPVKVFSLDKENCLTQIALFDTDRQQVESLAMIEMPINEAGQERSHSTSNQIQSSQPGVLFLFVGLKNGVIKRATMDQETAELSDFRQRFLGRKPVKFFKIKVRSHSALLALSSRVWLTFSNQGRLEMKPISIEPLDNASSFASKEYPEAIVATSENSLKIFNVDRLSDLFNQVTVPLNYTPKRFIVHPQTNFIILLETETNYNTYSLSQEELNPVKKEENDMDTEEDSKDKTIYRPKIGGVGNWKSLIRLLDPVTNQTLDILELGLNEAALSLCTVNFGNEGEIYLAVGTGTGIILNPKSFQSASIHLYRFTQQGRKLELVYKTEVEEPVYALSSFQYKLAAGISHCLRIYEMGKKKLLRKCETKSLPNIITNIHSQGDRLVVSDVQESIHFVKYKKDENMMYVFADDSVPRYVTASCVLDYDTVAAADKFGNIYVVRLPLNVSDEVEEDPTGSKLRFESGYLNGAPHKLEQIANFYVGETVNTLCKVSLIIGGPEVILYTTLSGSIGALIPFTSREDVDLFSSLEIQMRQENPPLCGRDHLSYRSYYFPVKNVIDGDLCEQFSTLDPQKQRSISEELTRSPQEVLKKLQELRASKLI